MSTIKVKENEPFDVALRRFKRLVEKTGLLNDLRRVSFMKNQRGKEKEKLLLRLKDNTVASEIKCFLQNSTNSFQCL